MSQHFCVSGHVLALVQIAPSDLLVSIFLVWAK